MVNTNNLKKGIVIKVDGGLYEVLEYFHYKPGKGHAFVRAKLQNIYNGSIVDKKLKAGEDMEDVFIEKKNMQYLYQEGDNYIFMDTESFEQIPVTKKELKDSVPYLKDGMEALFKFIEGNIVGVEIPAHVVLEVAYTEKGIKGDTATSATKPIKLESGIEVQAPLFVNIGDKVKIDTRTGQYVERV